MYDWNNLRPGAFGEKRFILAVGMIYSKFWIASPNVGKSSARYLTRRFTLFFCHSFGSQSGDCVITKHRDDQDHAHNDGE